MKLFRSLEICQALDNGFSKVPNFHYIISWRLSKSQKTSFPVIPACPPVVWRAEAGIQYFREPMTDLDPSRARSPLITGSVTGICRGDDFLQDCLKLNCQYETFEKCSILFKVKPPARRACAPEGKTKILTTGIH